MRSAAGGKLPLTARLFHVRSLTMRDRRAGPSSLLATRRLSAVPSSLKALATSGICVEGSNGNSFRLYHDLRQVFNRSCTRQ